MRVLRLATALLGIAVAALPAIAAAPFLVKDINTAGVAEGSNMLGLAAVGNVAFFYADDGEHGLELWKTDGTAQGTTFLKDIQPGSRTSFVTRRSFALGRGSSSLPTTASTAWNRRSATGRWKGRASWPT